jgi:hypothetical protein
LIVNRIEWMAYSLRIRLGSIEEEVMPEKTCAACDCPLDANSIKLTVGGKTVDVCCNECAQKLNEAHASPAPRTR